MDSIFEYKDYRKYLLDHLQHLPKHGRGVRGQWAESAGCQVAYVSHVLGGSNEFSLEQAEAISRSIGHTKDEHEYFILLVELARASTPHLRQFFQQMLKEKLTLHQNIRHRMKIKESLKVEDQATYYSKWHYGAIHMILTIPDYQTAQTIAQYFSMPVSEVKEYLEFLETRHLIEQKSGRYVVRGAFLHISKDSPLFFHQQILWRHKAIEAIYKNAPDAIHFASCFSVSEKDVAKLKEILGKTIETTTDIIKPSKEEKLYSLSMDFFEVK